MSLKLLPKLFACIVLLGAPSFASTARADVETRQVGNQDGESFVAGCSPGQAVVGWFYSAEEALRAIGVVCQAIEGDGRTSGPARKSGGLVGGEGGKGYAPITCNEGQSIQRLDITLTEFSGVHSIRGTCHGPGKAPEIIKATVATGAPGSKGIADCNSGTYATAVVGTYKDSGARQGILSLGLLCHDIGEAEDDSATTDNGDDGEAGQNGFQLDINIGSNGIEIGGGGEIGSTRGKKRYAQQPTTIYARPAGREIAFLEEGDTVTIVGCEDDGDGWCRISKPTKGFVWGGDLN